MSVVGDFQGVHTRRDYVIGLFTEYQEGALEPGPRFTVEAALEDDPSLALLFESYRRTIAIVRETFRSRAAPSSQLTNLLRFLRDNTRKTC